MKHKTWITNASALDHMRSIEDLFESISMRKEENKVPVANGKCIMAKGKEQ